MYKANSWSVLITTLLCFTLWGGIIALPILGLIQIAMSIKIITHFQKLPNHIKALFIIYSVVTISSIIIFISAQNHGIDGLTLMLVWAIISIFLALFHLIITYKIKKHELPNS